MNPRPRLVWIAAALGAVGLFGVNHAMGADFVCNGVVNGGTINDNVVVPAGANCTLNAVTVIGNIEVKSDGSKGGELYFGTFDGGEGSHCFNTSNVDGSIAVKGSGSAFAGFGVGGGPTTHCLN